MFLQQLTSGIIVFLLSMTPLGELRLGIPIGIAVYKLSPLIAMAWGILGNIFAAFLVIKILKPTVPWIFNHSPFLTKYLKAYFEKLHKKHSDSFNKKGALFLAIFVAIPIPGTGAWAGSALAYVFNIPFKLSLAAISLGVAIAGIIVTFGTESIVKIISLFQA